MNKCLNPECGKMFEPTKGHKNQRYCCRQCNQRHHYLKSYKPKTERKPFEVVLGGNERPMTRFTVYLIHKWHKEGASLTDISYILNRKIEQVIRALQIPLTEGQKATMEEYLVVKKGC